MGLLSRPIRCSRSRCVGLGALTQPVLARNTSIRAELSVEFPNSTMIG